MKYKIGDAVTIRSDLELDKEYPTKTGKQLIANDEMVVHKGKKAIIHEVSYDCYAITIDGRKNEWNWSQDMFEEGIDFWAGLSKTALTDAEGELYKDYLNNEQVSKHAAFSFDFWQRKIIRPNKRKILENPHLTIDEIVTIRGNSGMSGEAWKTIAEKRNITFEEMLKHPIETGTFRYKNPYGNHAFTKEEWGAIIEKTGKEVAKRNLDISSFTLKEHLFPIEAIAKKWSMLIGQERKQVSRYQPITFSFALTKKEEIYNFLLEKENKMHELTKAQLKKIRTNISNVFDEKIERGKMFNWTDVYGLYILSEWFLEKHKHIIGEELVEAFKARDYKTK